MKYPISSEKTSFATAGFPETRTMLFQLMEMILAGPGPKDVVGTLSRALGADEPTARRVIELMQNEIAK